MADYKAFIEDNFKIIDKNSQEIPFKLNTIQDKYLRHDSTNKDVILKARQQGFSSVILAVFTADFLLKPNSRNVVVADLDDNATELLDRVKKYIESYEEINQTKVPLKYNSKTELYNEANGSRYTIGTAKNTEFGRSKTITNLHLSEAAFYNNMEKIILGAGQAVVPTGRMIIETTANGFNFFKSFWEDTKIGDRPYTPLFYKASDFYDSEFLEAKKKELKEKFSQEYPETDIEAFLASGEYFFDSMSMRWYLENAKEQIQGGIYV